MKFTVHLALEPVHLALDPVEIEADEAVVMSDGLYFHRWNEDQLRTTVAFFNKDAFAYYTATDSNPLEAGLKLAADLLSDPQVLMTLAIQGGHATYHYKNMAEFKESLLEIGRAHV